MRLFHVSEEPDIKVFEPRLPTRKDLNQNIGLVWAIDEARLPNFLTPRDCPRVAYPLDFFRAAASTNDRIINRRSFIEYLHIIFPIDEGIVSHLVDLGIVVSQRLQISLREQVMLLQRLSLAVGTGLEQLADEQIAL